MEQLCLFFNDRNHKKMNGGFQGAEPPNIFEQSDIINSQFNIMKWKNHEARI